VNPRPRPGVQSCFGAQRAFLLGVSCPVRSAGLGGAGFAPSPEETSLPQPGWPQGHRPGPMRSFPPQHQQQVVQAVERAKQVTMTDLNAAIGVRQPSAHPFPPAPAGARGFCTSRARSGAWAGDPSCPKHAGVGCSPLPLLPSPTHG